MISQSTSARGVGKNSKFSNQNSNARPSGSRGKVPATRCEGPRGFRSTFTKLFHAVVNHCDDSFMQQAQGRGNSSWDLFPRQGVFLLINPTPPAFIEFLFSRPTFCSIFFLFIIFCHYCKCLRACGMRMVVSSCAPCVLVWYGRAAVLVCQFSFSPNHDIHTIFLLRLPP